MRSRLLLASMCAFALAFTISSVPTEAGTPFGPEDVVSDTFSTAASSGGCLPPSAAVDMYLEAGSELAFHRGDDSEEACAKICDKFVDTCDQIAKISRTCQNRGGGKFTQLAKTVCGTLEDKGDRNSCKDETEFLQDVVKDCTDADRQRAGGCCENHRTICLKDCLDEPYAPWDHQACFTGPGGYAGGSCWFSLANSTF